MKTIYHAELPIRSSRSTASSDARALWSGAPGISGGLGVKPQASGPVSVEPEGL